MSYRSYLILYLLLGGSVLCHAAYSEMDALQEATSFAEKDDFASAAAKMEVALKEFVSTHGFDQQASTAVVPRTLRQYQSYLRLLSYFYVQQGSYSLAHDTLELIFKAEVNYGDKKLSQTLNRDRLLQWWLLARQGEKREGDRILAWLSEASGRINETCFSDYAHYLLGKIDSTKFLELGKKLDTKCNDLGKASEALTYFWIGEKQLLQNDRSEAEKNLMLFLRKSVSGDVLERGIVFKQLNLPSNSRAALIRGDSSKGNSCMCSMSRN